MRTYRSNKSPNYVRSLSQSQPRHDPAALTQSGAVIRALEKAGFKVVRIKGSHHILEHRDDPTRRTTVPLHKGKDIPRGLVRKIITDVGLTTEEFRDLL